jgi:hypothetical protein
MMPKISCAPPTFRVTWRRLALCLALLMIASSLQVVASDLPQDKLRDLQAAFRNPPADSRLMVRWWWFGSSVTKPEIEREIRAMKEGGIGGFEIQPVYPMSLDDPETGIRNLPYLSDGFIDALRFASDKAHELGMRMDVTLGSGWPYGGPQIPVSQAAGKLRIVKTPVLPGQRSLPLPSVTAGEKLLAAFLANGDAQHIDVARIRHLSLEPVRGGRLQLPGESAGPQTVLFFVASRTGQMVKRPALGAEGFVLDHFDHAAVASHLRIVGDRLMEAFGNQPPYAVFSDSLEVYHSDWTSDFLEQFRRRRGYDLAPHLPELVTGIGPNPSDIRHDWGKTLTELIDDNYFAPIRSWAREHNTKFRAQAYGVPAATLSSNSLVDLAEGEGTAWHEFSMLRWASSANHLAGATVTSSESFTWLHSPAFRATPLDIKAEADIDFLQGSNQLIAHGWPYSPETAGNPGWSFYAAGAFDDHNPWWIVMPEVTKYVQRVSYTLRQGKPLNDVALLLPTDDAWARSSPGDNSPSETIGMLLGPKISQQIFDAGLNLDYIDSDTIEKAAITYPVLILPGIERIPASTYEKIESYAKHGGILIATRTLPSRAPGLKEAQTDTTRVQEISERLFKAQDAPGKFIADESQLHGVLEQLLKPDFGLSQSAPEIGFVHRRTSYADLYFVANTSNRRVHRQATFRVSGKYAELWDPYSGKFIGLGKTATIDLDLEPYGSTVVTFSSSPAASDDSLRQLPGEHGKQLASRDLSLGWKVSFASLANPVHMQELHSWADTEDTKFYSGQAVYEKDVQLPSSYFQEGTRIFLDFGRGVPIVPKQTQRDGMRSWLESPVREAAQVYVNGKLAGSIWHPAYNVELTQFLQPGMNHLKLIVANLAINSLAGRSLPDYRLLNSRYGERFVPQDMEKLEPLPSGVVGRLHLLAFATEPALLSKNRRRRNAP